MYRNFTRWYLTMWWNATIDKHLKCLRYDIKSLHRNFTCWYLIIANLHNDKTWYYVFHAMSWTNITNTWLWYFSFLLMTKGEKYVDESMLMTWHVMHKFMHMFMLTCCKYSWWILQWLEFSLNSIFYQYGILIEGVCLNSRS